MRNLRHILLIFMLVLTLLAACGGTGSETEAVANGEELTVAADQPETENTEAMGAEAMAGVEAMKADVVANYADIVYASYQDSYETAVTLQTALQEFVNNPSEEAHQAAKDAWLASVCL